VVESVGGRLNRRDAMKLFGGAAAAAAGLAVAGGLAQAASPPFTPKVYTGAGAFVSLSTASPAQPASMFSMITYYEVVARGLGVGGAGSNSNEDDLSYLYTTASGNGTYSCLVRSVVSYAKDNGNSSAGIMLRSSTNPNAQNVTVMATDGNGVVFKWRTHDNDAEESWPMSIAIGVSAPIWVQLQLKGTTATVSYSQDGQKWYNPTSTAIILPSTYLVGLVATTTLPKEMGIDAFSNVSGFTPNTFMSIMPAPSTSTTTSS
jgi:regulation of enolase protein 1 (concanavalin A-like superfamily)